MSPRLTRFVSGESWMERTTALWGLSSGGVLDPAYVAELGRNARYLVPEAKAKVLLAAARGKVDAPVVATLTDAVLDQIRTELWQGTPRYAGLATTGTRSPFVAPSEARELGVLTQALVAVRPTEPKLPLVRDALVRLGAEDGWGQPNADAAALLALADWLRSSPVAPPSARVEQGGAVSLLTGVVGAPVGRLVAPFGGETRITNTGTAPLVALVGTRWIPTADGSEVAPVAQGFVVEREWLVVRPSGPMDRAAVTRGAVMTLDVGTVLEEHVRLVNPEERHHVVLTVPLAAGVEPLNPALLTSGREATPANATTAAPSFVAFLDDRVRYAFETLPKGTYDLYFRTRASTVGTFVQPAAEAELVYDRDVNGRSAGGRVVTRGR
jgi:uncharacterized protein YfaS (alpha-2-macroglobulin family)